MLDQTFVATALLCCVFPLAGVCSWSDLRSRRIPNRALVLALAFGVLAYATLAVVDTPWNGLKALAWGVIGLLLGALLLGPGYALKQLGAGDVKLLMTFGFLLGPFGTAFTLIGGAIIGGIWALALSWRHGGLPKLLSNLSLMARTAYASGFRDMGWDLRSAGAVRMPYGVALSAGACGVAGWQLGRLWL